MKEIIRKVWGMACLVTGILLGIQALSPNWIPQPFQMTSKTYPWWFVGTAAAFVPFVLVYTNLGLNQPDGGPIDKQAQRRLRELQKICPAARYFFWTPIGIVGVTFVLWMSGAVKDANPMYSFVSAVLLVSGVWFLLIHPAAVEMHRTKWSLEETAPVDPV